MGNVEDLRSRVKLALDSFYGRARFIPFRKVALNLIERMPLVIFSGKHRGRVDLYFGNRAVWHLHIDENIPVAGFGHLLYYSKML